MKKPIPRLLLFMCMLFVWIAAKAETVKVTDSDIVYTIDLEAKTASATGYNAGITKANIASSVHHDGERYPVTSIGSKAFYNCTSLKSVSIGNSLRLILSQAFSGCTNLTSITIPESVTNIGKSAFSGCTALETVYFNAENCTQCESYAFPSNIKTLVIGDSVKNIPEDAFYGCTGMTTVSIGNSVSTIGDYAFQSCSGLLSITIPNSVTTIGVRAFHGCNSLETVYFNAENCTKCGGSEGFYIAFPTNLKTVVFGDKVKNIPSYAFYGCALTEVTIPESVTSIGDRAFKACASLETVYFNAENCITCSSPFSTNLKAAVVGDKVKNIPAYSFSGISDLTSVTMGESVKTIGDKAFYNCSGLKSVVTKSLESWVNIEFENFYSNPTYYAKTLLVGDESIRRLTIPDGTTRLNKYAFINCEPLVTANIPASLASAGESVFGGCTGLQRIIFPDEATFIGINYDDEKSFLNYSNKAKYYIGSSLYDTSIIENIVIPESLNYIPDYAFYRWPRLNQVTIHDKVERIGKYAFYECKALASLTLPESLTTIGNLAFYNCYGIPTLNIPNAVTKIGASAFNRCSGLTSLTLGSSVSAIGNYAFCYCEKIPAVKIPESVDSIGKDAFEYCHKLKSVTVDDVNKWARISFGNNMANPLYYAKNLYVGESTVPVKNIEITGEEAINAYSFYNAACLERVRVKDGAPVGDQAFYGCSNLNSICIDTNELGASAFANCTKIENVYVPVETPPSALDNAFSNYEGVNLYVPEGCVSKYENAETCWWRFLDVYESDFADVDSQFKPDYGFGESGVEDIDFGDTQCSQSNDIYNMQGVCIKRNASADDVKALAPGLYIVAGKKLLVK